MRREKKWIVKWNERKMIKYSIVHEICEPNLEWNSDKSQNREIIESLLKWSFLNFSLNFGKNFEMKSSDAFIRL
jgi:hypothetical protein